MHKNYNDASKAYPYLKKIFPAAPLVAFERNPTLANKIVRARFGNHDRQPFPIDNSSTRIKVNGLMNTTGIITNRKSGKSSPASVGTSTETGVLYAAIAYCVTRCKLIYIGHTKFQLNTRFNNHRSHITAKPNSCELVNHFATNTACKFDKDLAVTILERNLSGPRQLRELQEDKWIFKLDTLHPNGLNVRLTEYGTVYNNLLN